MTSPLLVNTHLNRQQGRWQPSINTSTIREEDGLQRTVEENEVDGDDDDDDDDNVALGHLGKNGVNSEEELDPDDEDDEDDEDDDEDEDDDDDEDETNEDEDDDSSTFTSSPSIPDENIDFDLVYTLHTFEATVEGQASVVKGDSLTLLDDSNSYWWLVKVLKSNEVGYIPAENIETPFERLARLNKHRNVEVTAIQQASHYINPEDEAAKAISKKQRKQVTMNKDIYYQSHIILLGDDDEELEETYEEWEGDMVDEDSQSTMLASEDDNGMDTSDTEMDQGDEQPSNNTTTDEEVQGLRITTSSAATTSNGATRPTTSDDLNNKDSTTATKQLPTKPTPLTTTAQSSSSPIVSPNGTTPLTPISTLKDDKENKKHGGSFLRLFSRGKRQDGKKLGGSQTYPMDNTSDQGSTNSSTISADDSQQQSTVPASSSTSSMTALDPSATVLRVYAGNINVNATYNSVLVYDHTNAEALLRQAMDRFHISQIEGKARGKRSSMTSSPSQYPHQQHSSGVEYYISVKPNDGDELTLLPQDKPLIIYQSLTAHLTTPMPSLSSLKQQITNVEFGRIGSPANNSSSNKRTGTKFGEDSIRFYLHKRIKRVNEQDGKLYVKVSLYHENDVTKRDRKNSDNGKQRSVSSNSVGISSSNNHNDSKHSIHGGSYTSLSTGSFSMRRKKSTSATVNSLASTTTATSGTQSQIDKLIAVSSMATVADLIDIALEKFHLLQQPGQEPIPRYRMLIAINSQGPEKHLNPNSKLVEVLHDDTNAKNNTTEKRFVLRKVTTTSSRSGNNTRLSQHHRGTPEQLKLNQQQQKKKQQGEELDSLRSSTSPLLTPIPVMQLDTEMEMVLRRLERALVTFHRKKSLTIDSVPPRLQLDPQQPKLAVMRNVNQGVDVYLPHGILRSKPLPPQQTQYVLMANNDNKKKDSAWELVTQRVLSNTTTTTPNGSSVELVADVDLKALIKFATLFLETAEQSNGGDASLLPVEESLQPSSSLSSLDELERELQRIMASHTIS